MEDAEMALCMYNNIMGFSIKDLKLPACISGGLCFT